MVKDNMDALSWLRKQLLEADPDLLGDMVKVFTETVMSAEADVLCGADYGCRSEERVNRRNGYRERSWDTRASTIALQVPKLREGSYYPDWLLEPRRRAERAFVCVVAEAYVRGVSTRRIEGLVKTLGIERISKSRVFRNGQGVGRSRRGLPQPAPGRGPLHLRVDGRPCTEGP